MIGLYLELTKARLSALVLLTTAVGFVLATPAAIDWALFTWTLLGTALAAGCANALNQVFEAPRDRRMIRTAGRPLPSGAMSRTHAFVAAAAMGYVGIGLLAVLVNLYAAALALLTIVLYVAMYTPLKPRSTLNTLVGAVCGAIPPMIGWAAASGTIAGGAWLLAAILFVWQIPHFFALAWLYREDYARGGFCMVPVLDRGGEITGRVAVLTSMLLVPLALIGVLIGMAGLVYAVGSFALGVWLMILAGRFYVRRSDASARAVFVASIVYLAALLGLFVADQDRGQVSEVKERWSVAAAAGF
jgi:heme o synthase